MLFHVLNKGFCKLQLISWSGDFPTSQAILCLFLICTGIFSHFSLFTHVSSEGNQKEVFVNIIHNLGFKENLSCIIHDYLKLSSEQGILVHIHTISVHFEEIKIHSWN